MTMSIQWWKKYSDHLLYLNNCKTVNNSNSKTYDVFDRRYIMLFVRKEKRQIKDDPHNEAVKTYVCVYENILIRHVR